MFDHEDWYDLHIECIVIYLKVKSFPPLRVVDP